MWGAIAGIAGGGLLAGLAGSQGQQATQGYTKQLAPESALEKQAGQVSGDSLAELQRLMNRGPGQQDVMAGLDSSRALAALLGQYAQGGFMPSQQDFATANQFTQNVFAPEQTALSQRFQDAQMMARRESARLGRSANDPVLLNKLLSEQTRQQQQLASQMTAYSAQQAQNLPMQRLQFTQNLAQVNQGLASQALANRQALLSAGAQLRGQEQNFRAGTASGTQTTSSGGGFQGFLSGMLGGIGTGAAVYSAFKNDGTSGKTN